MYVSTGLSYKFYHVILTKLLCGSHARTGNPFIGKGSLKQEENENENIPQSSHDQARTWPVISVSNSLHNLLFLTSL